VEEEVWEEEEAVEEEEDLEVDREEGITKEEGDSTRVEAITSNKEDTEATSREVVVAWEVTRAEVMVVDSKAGMVVETKEVDTVETRAVGMEVSREATKVAIRVDMAATKEEVVTREEIKVAMEEDSNRVVTVVDNRVVTRATRVAEITTREVQEVTRVVTKVDTEAVTKVTRAATVADTSSNSQEVQIRRGEEVVELRTATSPTRSHTD